jgi:hypothetical protein
MAGLVDYSAHFPTALAAQGKGYNFLALYKLPEPTNARFDGKPARYELVHRWLSRECERENDGAYCCAKGSETTYWQHRELSPALFAALRAGTVNLFEHFNLF